MKITIEVVPHERQRYPTVGDWAWYFKDHLQIFVSDMGNWKYEALVAVHELVEVLLCKDRGITQEQVDNFDIEFEKNRKEEDLSEPGNDPRAPYKKEHEFATEIEGLLARELGVEWDEYDKTVNSL